MIPRGRVQWGRMGRPQEADVDMRRQAEVEEGWVGMRSRRNRCFRVEVVVSEGLCRMWRDRWEGGGR